MLLISRTKEREPYGGPQGHVGLVLRYYQEYNHIPSSKQPQLVGEPTAERQAHIRRGAPTYNQQNWRCLFSQNNRGAVDTWGGNVRTDLMRVMSPELFYAYSRGLSNHPYWYHEGIVAEDELQNAPKMTQMGRGKRQHLGHEVLDVPGTGRTGSSTSSIRLVSAIRDAPREYVEAMP